MSILTSLLRKAAPERFALYEEHVRYEKTKQFHNLRVTNRETSAQLKEEINRLANLIRNTRDEQTRIKLQVHQAGLATEIADTTQRPGWQTFKLPAGTHLRLWRQAAESFRAGYNRFSLAAVLKRSVDNPGSGWLKARDEAGNLLPSESLAELLPAPTMSRDEAIASISKYGATQNIGNTDSRFKDCPGTLHLIDHSDSRNRAARAAFFKPIGEVNHRFLVKSDSATKNGSVEHTIMAHPAYGSIALPGALGSANENRGGHDLASNPAIESEIIHFYRKRVEALLLKNDALENSAYPDQEELETLRKRIAQATRPLLKRGYDIPTLEDAKIRAAENEEIRQRAIRTFGHAATGAHEGALLNEHDRNVGYATVRRSQTDPASPSNHSGATGLSIIPEEPIAEEPIYVDMSGVRDIKEQNKKKNANRTVAIVLDGEIKPEPSSIVASIASKEVASKIVLPRPAATIENSMEDAVEQFRRAWNQSSGAATVDIAVAKNTLKAIAAEQLKTIARETDADLGAWRKNINERFYAHKIELSNAHRAGDREAYLDALINVHVAQAEYNEVTNLFFANKLEHPAQAKFVTIYERQAAKVTANNQPSTALVDAQAELRIAAGQYFKKTHAKITRDNAQAFLFEAKAKKTSLAITSTALRQERTNLDAAGHTPYTHERIDLRTRAALHNAAVYWNEEWLEFLQNKITR